MSTEKNTELAYKHIFKLGQIINNPYSDPRFIKKSHNPYQ